MRILLFGDCAGITSDALRLSDVRGINVVGYGVGFAWHCRSDKAIGRHPTLRIHLIGNGAGITSDALRLSDLRGVRGLRDARDLCCLLLVACYLLLASCLLSLCFVTRF